MAGGTFNPKIDKILPGTYINYENGKPDELGASERGICLLPLIGADYGPEGEIIEISNRFPNGQRAKLGHDIYDDHPIMFLIRQAIENAVTVKCWIPKQGAKAMAEPLASPIVDPDASDSTPESGSDDPETDPVPIVPPVSTGLTAEAKYGGSRGNDLSFSILANPTGGYDVSIFLGKDEMEAFEGLAVVEDLILEDSDYITFGGSGPLPETAGTVLSGGTDGETTNDDMIAFAEAMDNIKFTTLAFPVTGHRTSQTDNTELLEAIVSKIIHLRDDCGKYVNAVLPEFAANHESIINITNGYILEDGTVVSPELAVAWVGGLTCSSTNVQSNTYVPVTNAVKVYKPKAHEKQEQAILDGEFFFITDDDDTVVICKDINSLVDFEKPKDESYSHNRIMRVIDTFCEAVRVEFPPNRFDNNTRGWDLMDGLGAALQKKFEDEGALQNVEKGDFAVDRSKSEADRTYFDVALHPVDSAEKLYFSVKTL